MLKALKRTGEVFLSQRGLTGEEPLRFVDRTELTASVISEQHSEFNTINPWLEALQPPLQCQTDDEVAVSDQALSSADYSWEFTKLLQLWAAICQTPCNEAISMGACWESLGITEEALERQSLRTHTNTPSDTEVSDVFPTLYLSVRGLIRERSWIRAWSSLYSRRDRWKGVIEDKKNHCSLSGLIYPCTSKSLLGLCYDRQYLSIESGWHLQEEGFKVPCSVQQWWEM